MYAYKCQFSELKYPSSIKATPLTSQPNGFVVEVEANIIDKGYTAQAKFVYSYSNNAAAVTVFSQGADHRYIFSYYTDEIFTISGKTGKIT